MSEVMKALRGSADPLENDLARVYDHWQEVKRSQDHAAVLTGVRALRSSNWAGLR
ncbi:hypothetical protein [Jannaschia seohaensis]|uniref:Uncharacterized protein n=1 Tax=Jannaschia seohaensis TaxID=475081 RepID=A0A2Y9C964_9RHOB|nr:hypothetical protein [Jannaschia seohaensis]PWJ10902.1 hypothetical protein BCF38_1214 [Jannaschia seohaensis]SSA51503.1 hypothetical protein SAMN05421539_1214 [Jannaschia seohaensis]